MSQTFTAPLTCHRADARRDVSSRLPRATRAGFVSVFAQALIRCNEDLLQIPMHD